MVFCATDATSWHGGFEYVTPCSAISFLGFIALHARVRLSEVDKKTGRENFRPVHKSSSVASIVPQHPQRRRWQQRTRQQVQTGTWIVFGTMWQTLT
jgi:hypothetical protein